MIDTTGTGTPQQGQRYDVAFIHVFTLHKYADDNNNDNNDDNNLCDIID